MKKNVWKFLKFVLLGLAVIIVCILLLLQCPGDKITREKDSVQPSVETVKEKPGETKKQDLSDSSKVTESEKKIPLVRKKLVHKTNKSLNLKKNLSYLPDQTDELMEKSKKPKDVEALAEKVKILSEKVDVLRDKVRALLERVEAVLKKKKMDIPVGGIENLDTEKKEIQTADEVTFKYPTHVLTVGISTYKDWTPYGFQGSYDYRISKYFSLGLQGNAFFKEGKFQADRSIYVGLRANFHIFPLLVKNSNFDLYAGGSIGAGRDDAVATFETMGYLGASYDFSRRWGIFVEAGNIGVVGLRVKF
ncbi:hypothetical protein [Ancylomarina salipaludis]|nr:hypothetical protein [Ancylomarina salipaludis]